jgi:hypothetical protein
VHKTPNNNDDKELTSGFLQSIWELLSKNVLTNEIVMASLGVDVIKHYNKHGVFPAEFNTVVFNLLLCNSPEEILNPAYLSRSKRDLKVMNESLNISMSAAAKHYVEHGKFPQMFVDTMYRTLQKLMRV